MIRFYVDEQSINLKVNRTIASDTINFVKLEFVFCESWKGYNKTVQFTQCTNTYSINLGTEGTSCYLPNEITDGLCAISVFGIYNDKRATTVPYQVRIKRSGFMENSIIPSDTQLTVIEQLIKDVDNLKTDITDLNSDISDLNLDITNLTSDIRDLNSSVAAMGGNKQNRLVEAFDMQFGRGFHDNELDVYYDKETNTLTINGATTTEKIAGAGGYDRRVYLDMGCYEFVDCPTGNIFEDGHTSQLPFKLSFNPYINENVPIGKYAIITDKTTAAAQPNRYNKLKRDCYGTMSLIIPAGSSFNNQTFHPYLTRYSASIE